MQQDTIIEGNKLMIFKERGYKILDTGVIIGAKGSILKLQKNRNGYPQINILIGGRQRTYMVHRLVAELFISNPEKLPEVNHKDGDKANNSISNLEWCSRSQNIKHGIENGLIGVHMKGKFGNKHHMSKPVMQFDLSGAFINEF